MFGKMKNMMDQFKMMQEMMKDENFRAFISHPKIQEMMKDPEFIAAMKTQDFAKIASHPKFAVLRTDPELMTLASKLKMPQ